MQAYQNKYLKRMSKVASNPRKAAENNYLEYLEYQHMRERQAAAQKFIQEQMAGEKTKEA